MTALKISTQLSLPLDAVTETFALLAKRGAGKSNAAVVMAEQMYDAGLPWVAVDPKGDWWGVRSDRDGTGPGLPVLVLGGQKGDVPLEPTGGALVADLIATERLTAVVDVSLMSKAEARRFLADFAERLYKANTEPLHVFAEEAHEYIPQRVTAGDARMVGAWEKLVKWGRTHGLGVTLITQRSASLNKDVLTQVETLIALRTTGPQDVAAIRSWVDEHETGKEVLAELRKLPSGDAYVLSPQWLELDAPLRITFHRRRTFDSGATPKAGQKRTTPRSIAEVDLDALTEAMADTIERAKADDPKQLRSRVAELERALADEQSKPAPEPVVERVEVPVLAPEIVDQLEALLEPAVALLAETQETLTKHRMWAEQQLDTVATVRPQTSLPSRTASAASTARPDPMPARQAPRRPTPTAGQGSTLPKAQAILLGVLVQMGEPLTVQRLSLLSGYSMKSSGFKNSIGALRSAGYAVGGRDAISATAEGVEVLGPVPPLPSGPDLVAHWMGNLGRAERTILEALLQAWPESLNVEEISEATGYSTSSSGFKNALGRLRTLQLAHGDRDATYAADVLGEAAS